MQLIIWYRIEKIVAESRTDVINASKIRNDHRPFCKLRQMQMG